MASAAPCRRGALTGLPLALLLALLTLPAAAGAFTVSLPADTAVTVEAPSRLLFRVTNTAGSEALSRLALRFPSGYRVTGGSAPPGGWAVELSPGTAAEISFRTSDEGACTGSIAPGSSLVFGVEVVAPGSRAVGPDGLVNAQGEQICRGVVLDPPATLPSWNRLGLAAALAAGPPILGLGGEVTVTMTVENLSTVELTDIAALLSPSGTAGVSGVAGPAPGTLTLAPGAASSMTWTARAASAGTLSFGGQAVSKSVNSSPARSDTLFVGDLEVSLDVTPEQVVSGQEVQVQMTVTNRGPIRPANVTPSPLTFQGTATASAPAGPSPASQPALEPGEAVTFAWTATISGEAGATYAFAGWASAEAGAIVSLNAISNSGTLGPQAVASKPQNPEGSGTVGGGGVASAATEPAASPSPASSMSPSGGTAATAAPSATVQFVGVGYDGRLTGGAEFLAGLLGDLRISVNWKNLSGTHTQRLELWTPNGFLYQTFSAAFAGTPPQALLLVGGTWITEHSLFGAWRVDVYLDQERMPITSGAFVLTP